MAPVLTYSSPSNRDHLTTILMACTWSFVPLDSIAALFLSGLHSGFRTSPMWDDLQARDVLATALICGIPLVGILLGLLLIWRCRKGLCASIFWGTGAVLVHSMNLHAWGSIELGTVALVSLIAAQIEIDRWVILLADTMEVMIRRFT